MGSLYTEGEIYIHYYPEHIKKLSLNKEAIINRITSQDRIKSLMVKTLGKTDKISQQEIDAYFQFLGGFGTQGVLQQAIQSKINTLDLSTLSTGFTSISGANYDNFYHAFSSIQNNPDLQSYSNELLPQIRKLNQQLSMGVNKINEAIIDDYVSQGISRGYFIAPPVFDDISNGSKNLYEAMKQIYETKNAITFKPSSELEKYKNVLTHFLVLEKLLERVAASSGEYSNAITNNKILNDFVAFFVNMYQKTMGFAYQTMVANFEGIQIDNLLVNFVETGAERVQKSYHRDTSNSESTTVKTADVSLTATITSQGMNTYGNLIANFLLPDISVKFSSGMLNSAKNSNITIKGAATRLDTLLHDLDNQTLSYIYNVIASYKRKIKIGRSLASNPIDRKEYEEMWQILKMASVVNGLVGQMTKDDFSYYFIIGKKVFTLPEIIDKLVDSFKAEDNALTQIGINGGKTMMLEPSQVTLRGYANKYVVPNNGDIISAAQKRSKEALNAIASAHIKRNLSIRISRI